MLQRVVSSMLCRAGGNAAANAIQEECERQSVLCSVVGIPKSVRLSLEMLVLERRIRNLVHHLRG